MLRIAAVFLTPKHSLVRCLGAKGQLVRNEFLVHFHQLFILAS